MYGGAHTLVHALAAVEVVLGGIVALPARVKGEAFRVTRLNATKRIGQDWNEKVRCVFKGVAC